MEPVVVKSNLDLNTYYKISMSSIFRRIPIIILFVIFITTLGYCIFTYSFDWDNFSGFIIWGAVFFILLPLTTWLRCKKNMKIMPVLAEGTIYTINDEFIENVSPSCTSKTNWKNITKAVEKDQYLILYTNTRGIHFLPKNGFTATGNIDKLKEMVKVNRIKAYFK